MPTYTIETPLGKRLTIDAPDEAQAMAGAQQWHAENGGSASAPAAEPPGVLSDAAQSLGIGAVKGGIGLAGMGGDVRDLASTGVGKIAGMFGGNPENVAAMTGQALRHAPIIGPALSGPASADIQKGIEGVTGEFYKPKTTVGEGAQTVGEFLPAALVGPGGLARRVLTQVAAPALASETAGQIAKSTTPEAEPYARVGGALVGGGLASVRRATEAAVPSLEGIKDAAQAGYKHPVVESLEIKPASVQTAGVRIIQELHNAGFRRNNVGQTFGALDELMAPTGAAAKVADIDSVSKNLGVLSKEVNTIGKPTTEATAAGIAKRKVDDYLANIKAPDVISGDAAAASTILKEARSNWAAYMKGSDVDARLTRAERQAAKSGSGSNIDNAVRQKISAILDVPSRTVGFTPAEIDQMEKIVRGTWGSNVARKLGKLGVDGGLSLLLHSASAYGTGGGTIPIAVAGTLMRKLGEAITQRNAEKLQRMIAARSPLAAKIPQPIPAPSLSPPVSAGMSGLLGAPAGLQPAPIADQRRVPIEQ